MASLALKNITKKYGSNTILESIDLDIRKGEFVVFVGPSGCGKSTLLRIIAGLTDITEGDVSIGEKRVNGVPPAERKIAMVFQSYALYPHMTVGENMGFSLRMAKEKKEVIAEKVLAAAKILQLDVLLDRKPKALSGGQRQRVAIGRAIVRQPEVFLFDEPLSNLDAELRVDMRIQIAKLHKQLQSTMIYVTHDQVEAMTMADKIVVLKGGYLQQAGAPLELYHYPCNQFVAGFIGSPKMNFIPVTFQKAEDKGVTVKINGQNVLLPVKPAAGLSYQPGSPLMLGVRPKCLNVHGEGAFVLKGKTEVIEKLGGVSYAYIAVDGTGDQITVEIEEAFSFSEDKQITLGVKAEDCHLFDENTIAFPRQVKLQTH